MTANVKAIVRISSNATTPFITLPLLALDVNTIYEITGKYDMMIIIAALDIETLNKIIDKIRNLNGVISTSTEIVLKEINND